MYTMHMKNWFQHWHVPEMHLGNFHLSHIVRDQRFWAITALAALLIFLTVLIVFAASSGGGNPDISPFYYGREFPYGPVPFP